MRPGAQRYEGIYRPTSPLARDSKLARERFGPLRPGIDYTEGKGGRIVLRDGWSSTHIGSRQWVDASGKARKVRAHVAAVDSLALALHEASLASGYVPASVQTFVPRHINWNPKLALSLHSYGIAVDIDPKRNPRGQRPGSMDAHPAFVDAMERRGWYWAGRWKGASRDSMHFEASTKDGPR